MKGQWKRGNNEWVIVLKWKVTNAEECVCCATRKRDRFRWNKEGLKVINSQNSVPSNPSVQIHTCPTLDLKLVSHRDHFFSVCERLDFVYTMGHRHRTFSLMEQNLEAAWDTCKGSWLKKAQAIAKMREELLSGWKLESWKILHINLLDSISMDYESIFLLVLCKYSLWVIYLFFPWAQISELRHLMQFICEMGTPPSFSCLFLYCFSVWSPFAF